MRALRTKLLELAYRGEVLFSRLQGIAFDHPRRNGEYLLIRSVRSVIETAVDIGANKGDWSAEVLSSAPRVKRVICAEPDAGNAALLRKRFAGEARVSVCELAVSESVGMGNFVQGGGAGSGIGYLNSSDNEAGAQVRTTALDELARSQGLERLDLVKCDVEGEEIAVLQGAEPLFRSQAIGCMQVEYNSTWLRTGSRMRDVFEFANDHGYELMCASPLGFIRYSAYGEGLEDLRLRNLVLAREDFVRLLRPLPPTGRARVEWERSRAGTE